MPRILADAAEIIELRADLVESSDPRVSLDSVNLADLKAKDARLAEILDGLAASGIQVKGWAPLLLDLPSMHDGREVLLCWLEGETTLDWYHDPTHGFAGRRRLAS